MDDSFVSDSGDEFPHDKQTFGDVIIADSSCEVSNNSFNTANSKIEDSSDDGKRKVADSDDEAKIEDSSAEEEEDQEFALKALRTSIAEIDQDSDSDWEPKKVVQARSRRSIYEPPPTESSEQSDFGQSSSHESPVRNSLPVRSKRRQQQIIISDDSDDSNRNESTSVERSDRNSTKKNTKPSPKLSFEVSTPHHSPAVVKPVSRVAEGNKKSDEIVILSSSEENSAASGSDHIDPEVMAFVKKQVGVGNIDPIKAQKRECLISEINKYKLKLEKVEMLLNSNLEALPDKGEKVFGIHKELREKIKRRERELDEVNGSINIAPRVKNEPQTHSPYFERKKSVIKTSSIVLDLSTNEENRSPNILPPKAEKINFDFKDIPLNPDQGYDIEGLGKKALENLNHQRILTHDKLEKLHGSLNSRPNENEMYPDPPGLKSKLMPHQQHALAWLRWREGQRPRGGILADDMGLGKTLTMISLILSTLHKDDSSDEDSSQDSDDSNGHSKSSWKRSKRRKGGTLVVCPASLIRQWESEVKNHCKYGRLTVRVHHGANRTTEARVLAKADIVVTTYQLLVREQKNEIATFQINWERIILDEAHQIRNHASQACIAVCDLSARYRWALTGTPIQNKESDLYSLLKFLRVSPFDDIKVWKRFVENKNDAGHQRLITIMNTVMLRRTKQELQEKGHVKSLPAKSKHLMEFNLDSDEALVYKKILMFSQNLFAQFLIQRKEKQAEKNYMGGGYLAKSSQSYKDHQFTRVQKAVLQRHKEVASHEILTLILRLRQLCCHPPLIHEMLDKNEMELNGLEQTEDPDQSILNQLGNLTLVDGEEGAEHEEGIDKRVIENLLTKNNPVFNQKRKSSKVRKILDLIEKILDENEGDKIIVVSQFTSFLNVIASHLPEIMDTGFKMFTGEVLVKFRQEIVDKFNNRNSGVDILLLSLTAGGVGLNLTGANHLILADIHWNPQLEEQAQDRIYRFGQSKDVKIYKLVCKDTIEEKILAIQMKKLEIADTVLTGTRRFSSKLSMDDLKSLFADP